MNLPKFNYFSAHCLAALSCLFKKERLSHVCDCIYIERYSTAQSIETLHSALTIKLLNSR